MDAKDDATVSVGHISGSSLRGGSEYGRALQGDAGLPVGTTESAGERLDTWKEIASYFRRSVRSVQRWEKQEGMPIRRHQHTSAASVYAYRLELDAWWHGGSMNARERGENSSSVIASVSPQREGPNSPLQA